MANMTFQERLTSLRKQIAEKKEEAKTAALAVVDTALAGGTALAIGVLDQAKGTVVANSASGISQHMLGPVPTSLAVGVLAKGGGLALEMSGESIGRQVGAIGQGALDAAGYVAGRNIWAKHEQTANSTGQ